MTPDRRDATTSVDADVAENDDLHGAAACPGRRPSQSPVAGDEKSTDDEPEDRADQQSQPQRCGHLRPDEADDGLAPVLKDKHHHENQDDEADDLPCGEREPAALRVLVLGHANAFAIMATTEEDARESS